MRMTSAVIARYTARVPILIRPAYRYHRHANTSTSFASGAYRSVRDYTISLVKGTQSNLELVLIEELI